MGSLRSNKFIGVAYFKPNCKLCILSGGCLKNFHFVLYIWVAEKLKRTYRIWKKSFHNHFLIFLFFFSINMPTTSCIIQVVFHTSDLPSWQPDIALSPTLLSFLSSQLFCLCFLYFPCVIHIPFALYLLALHTEWAGWSSAPLCSACSASCRLESTLELVCPVKVQRGF